MKTLPVIQCCPPLAAEALSDDEAADLGRVFRALGDRHRVRILNLLMQAEGDAVCVCELVPTLGLAQATVSYHLRQLSDVGLLERERRGTFAYYRLVPGALERIREAFGERVTA